MEAGKGRSKKQSRRRPSRKTLFGRILFEFRWIRRNDSWILPAIAFATIGLIAVVLSFVRLWKVTPSWVHPSVRISLIDFVQAWSLGRSAEKFEAENDTLQALAAWKKAGANNPARISYIKGVMRNLRINSPSRESGLLTPIYGNWFMQLTQTNLESIATYAELHEKNHQFSKALILLSETQPLRSQKMEQEPSLKAIQLRCYFAMDKFAAFTKAWDEAPEEHQTNPNLKLQALAAVALLNRSPQEMKRFESTFENQLALTQPTENKIQLLRTGLRFFAGNGQSVRSKGILEKLDSAGVATLSDHAKHWNALILEGNQNEIIELSQKAPDPITEDEALGLIRLYQRANLAVLAEKQIVAFLDSNWSSPLLWIERGDQLIREERWTELKQIGLALQRMTAAHSLLAIANYWEGFAEARLKHQRAASASFQKILNYKSLPSAIAGRLATKIHDIGYAVAADAIALTIDGESSISRRYWLLRCSEALKKKDLASFYSYASQGFQADKSFLPHINNLAVALLLQRSDPEQSLKLTTRLIEANDSILFRINHAHALIQCQKLDEAESILDNLAKQLDVTKPSYSDYSVARFEIASTRQDVAAAIRWHAHIRIEDLLPEASDWITARLTALQERD